MLVVCLFGTTTSIRTKPRKEIKQDGEKRSVYFFFRESKSAEKNGFTTSYVVVSQCVKMKILLSLKDIPLNQLFSNLFSKTDTFTKFLPKLHER